MSFRTGYGQRKTDMRDTTDYLLGLGRRWGVERGQAFRCWLPSALVLAAAAAVFWSLCRHSPSVSFLPDDPPAKWIVFPAYPEMMIHRDGPRKAVFRRRFTIARPARDVRLSVRAMVDFAVAVNGAEVARSDPSLSWKTPCTRRVEGNLFRVGENELAATVTCERGPPALWLALDVDGEAVVSDESWQASLLGADPEPARLAASASPFSGPAGPRGAERTSEALAKVWPTCLAFGAFSALIVGLAHRLRRHANSDDATGRLRTAILFASLVVAWCAMAISNSRSLRFPMGYDSPLHMEFVDYIARNHRLPLGNEGMEMGQAPLYYVLASILTPLAETSADKESRALILRALSVLISIAQLGLLAGCLRQVYRERFPAQAAGLFVAGCLPVQLYLMHNTSNDLLAAMFATAGLYLAMRLTEQREPQLRDATLLGLCLGAAILAKLTALPVVLATLLVLLWQAAAQREQPIAWILRGIVPGAACGLVCGWFFVRNYLNFGQLLPPDQAGFAYWQDPGYAIADQFVRFGRVLSEPFLASFDGVPDGIYSTLWGDGGLGGVNSREARPPWNYDLMAAGYLLALVPTLLILIGSLSLVRQLVRRWEPQKLVLMAALAASLCAMIHFYLEHPMHGTVKAFYALPSVAAVCLSAAEGYWVLTRGIFWRQWLAATSLGAWGLTALASFVVDHASPQTQAWVARQRAAQGDTEAALAMIADATRAHPNNASVHLAAGHLLMLAEHPRQARVELSEAVRLDPSLVDAQFLLSHALGRLHEDEEEQRVLLENVVRLAPANRLAYKSLALLYLRHGDDRAASERARAGLRASPDEPGLHLVIAQASARLGDTERAIEHYKIVLEWEPDQVSALAGLALLYATHPDRKVHDTTLAVALAERASHLTGGRNSHVEGILAAARAEAGRLDAKDGGARD